MSILNLPIEKQREIAAESGETHSEWVEGVKARSKKNKKFLKEVQKVEAGGVGNMTPEERERFQKKMDSGNPR